MNSLKEDERPKAKECDQSEMGKFKIMEDYICCRLDMFRLNYLPSFSNFHFIKKNGEIFCLHFPLERERLEF